MANRAGTDGGSGGGAGGGPGTATDRFGVATVTFPGTMEQHHRMVGSQWWCAINQQQGAGGGGAGQIGYPNGPASSTPTRGFGGSGVECLQHLEIQQVYWNTWTKSWWILCWWWWKWWWISTCWKPCRINSTVGGDEYGVMDANIPTYDGAGGDGLNNTGSGGGGQIMGWS